MNYLVGTSAALGARCRVTRRDGEVPEVSGQLTGGKESAGRRVAADLHGESPKSGTCGAGRRFIGGYESRWSAGSPCHDSAGPTV